MLLDVQDDYSNVNISKHCEKEPLIRMTPNLNGILLKKGESVRYKEKKPPNFSNRWRCMHPNLKGFNYI